MSPLPRGHCEKRRTFEGFRGRVVLDQVNCQTRRRTVEVVRPRVFVAAIGEFPLSW